MSTTTNNNEASLDVLKKFLEKSGRDLRIECRDGKWMVSVCGLPGTEYAGDDLAGTVLAAVVNFVVVDWRPRTEKDACGGRLNKGDSHDV
jgi:hypothetical protein